MSGAGGSERTLDVIAIGRSSVDLYGQQSGSRLEDIASFAKSVGGNAYGVPGNVWYNSLKSSYSPNLTFAQFARITLSKAQQLYGAATATKLNAAWRTVGVVPAVATVQVAAR